MEYVTRDLLNLPEKYHFAHRLCFRLSDLMTDVVVQGGKDGIFSFTVDLKEKGLARRFKGLSGKPLLVALKEAGFEDAVHEAVFRTAVAGLLSDLCHFLYEALYCSQKGKLTVTFALLRKPFTENLLFLEWLLAEPKEFVSAFWKGDPSDVDIVRSKALKAKEHRLKVIAKAVEEISAPFVRAEYLYELRYDKSSSRSFQSYWNRSTHLITTDPHYKTEATSFNLVLSRSDEDEEQWKFLYTYLPFLIFHAHNVVEAVVSKFAVRKHRDIDFTEVRMQIGFILWLNGYPELTQHSEKELEMLMSHLGLLCPHCKATYVFDMTNVIQFYEKAQMHCGLCHNTYDFNAVFEAGSN